MDETYFDEQILKLERAFGGRSYNDQRKSAIWAHVHKHPNAWFGRLVDRLIEKERYAPLPAMFAEESRKFSPNTPGATKQEKWGCTHCKEGEGILLRYSNTGSPWAFRCSCDAGKSLGPQFSYFNQQVWSAIQNGEIKGVV